MKKAVIFLAAVVVVVLTASISFSGCTVDQQAAVQSAVESALE